MDIIMLIESILGLILVLGILLFLLFYSKKAKKNKNPKETQKMATDLESLTKVLKNRQNSSKKLKETLDLILAYHGTIVDFDPYIEIIFTICRHPNTTTEIILSFDKALEAKNPTYKHEINSILTQGLNSRGA